MNYHQHDGYFVLSWSFLVLVNCSPQLYMIQSMACFKARAAAVQIREHGIRDRSLFMWGGWGGESWGGLGLFFLEKRGGPKENFTMIGGGS